MTFTIVLTRDEEDASIYNASVPALPGCHTFGRTKKAAYKHAKEAIALYLESLIAHGEPIPEEVESMELEIDA